MSNKLKNQDVIYIVEGIVKKVNSGLSELGHTHIIDKPHDGLNSTLDGVSLAHNSFKSILKELNNLEEKLKELK